MKLCAARQTIFRRKKNSFTSVTITLFSFRREIASRAPHSFSTDVWSLGILIATLLTGQPPFETDSK